MGGTISHINNRLSFDFDSYIRERDELARLFHSLAEAATTHRQRKGTLQVVNGASGVAAGVAGAVAILTAPVTFGLTLPIGAAATAAIVGNSIMAASITSSAASYGYGHVVDVDIERRLHNLRYLIDCISEKDEQVNSLLRGLQMENPEPVLNEPKKQKAEPELKALQKNEAQPLLKACQRLKEQREEWDLSSHEKSVAYDLPVSVFKNQGLVFGTHSIMKGSKQVQEEQYFETALKHTADTINEETAIIRNLENRFKFISCIPTERRLPRGRLTYVDGGGGCTRFMVVTVSLDGQKESAQVLKSDSTNVIRLPEGATNIKVHLQVMGGKTVKKVDRSHAKQPWVKSSSGEYEIDVFDFDHGDGVDAVFFAQGSITHSYVPKAWDFGRPSIVKPRKWEWWENAEEECRELLPDIETRAQDRTARYDNEPCGLALCGSCFDEQDILLAPVA
jgi:hypothetical protein